MASNRAIVREVAERQPLFVTWNLDRGRAVFTRRLWHRLPGEPHRRLVFGRPFLLLEDLFVSDLIVAVADDSAWSMLWFARKVWVSRPWKLRPLWWAAMWLRRRHRFPDGVVICWATVIRALRNHA